MPGVRLNVGSGDARQLMQGSIASRARRTGRQTRTDSTSNTAATEAKAASHTGRHTQASRQPASHTGRHTQASRQPASHTGTQPAGQRLHCPLHELTHHVLGCGAEFLVALDHLQYRQAVQAMVR